MSNSLLTSGEKLYTLKELRRVAPVRRARHTYLRWITNGLKHPDTGVMVRLEHVRVGKYFHTSLEAVGRFLGAMTTDEAR